jgi:hypothetical protein
MSKLVYTLPTVFTREKGRVWTSFGAKRLKYSATERGVRCGADLSLELSLQRRAVSTEIKTRCPRYFGSAMHQCVNAGPSIHLDLVTPRGEALHHENHYRALADKTWIRKGLSTHVAQDDAEEYKGLYREVLTRPVASKDPKYNTFSITDRAYTTYMNVGFWDNVKSFDDAIGKRIPKPVRIIDRRDRRRKAAIPIEPFEFKIRERIILDKVLDRGGLLTFPTTDL